MKNKDTNIEIALEFLLRDLKLNFKKQHRVGNYPVDFFLKKYNLTIQVDGCWVHNHGCELNIGKKTYARQSFQKRRDAACVLYHKYSKINIIRIKECILADLEGTKIFILSIIKRIENGEKIYDK